MRQPNVALLALNFVPGATGGGETYLKELSRRLDPNRVNARLFLPESAAGTSLKIPETLIPHVPGGASTRERLTTTGLAMLRRRDIIAALGAADVVHLPLASQVPPMPKSVGRVVTIHDVAHLDLKERFSALERGYRKLLYDLPARHMDAVITVSEFSRARIIELLRVPAEKVHAILLGVEIAGFSPADVERENFVVYPARLYPHKNHSTLIAAMELLRTTDPTVRLVLTGEGLESLGELPDWVERRGHVTQEQLVDLYRRARVMVFPSLYEGFGLPPLEAMACGCPVASSDAGSLAEVVGDAAVTFDPRDPAAIAQAILEAAARSEDLRARGFARIKQFSWDQFARQHEDVYLKVYEERNARA